MGEKISKLEVVETLMESPLSEQLTEEELTESASRIAEMVNQTD